MTRYLFLADFRTNHYRVRLFQELHALLPEMRVVYVAERERRREWEIDPAALTFPHEVLFPGAVDDVPAGRLFTRTWRRLAALDPETVVADGYVDASSWAGVLWARRRGRKVVLWCSSNEDDRPRVFYKEALKRWLVLRCDGYGAYGERSKRYLVRLGALPGRVNVVGNCTDIEFYRAETRRWRARRAELALRYGTAPNNFLFVGRLHPEKNPFHLLDAYGRLDPALRAMWGLILVGDGPQLEDVAAYVRRHRLDSVRLIGPRLPAEIPQFMALASALVLPSVCDPWGLVVNEAMAAGLPVFVSRRCGCWPELVREGGNGLSFDPFDPCELHDILRRTASGQLDLEAMGRASELLIQAYTPRAGAERIARGLAEL